MKLKWLVAMVDGKALMFVSNIRNIAICGMERWQIICSDFSFGKARDIMKSINKG